ELFSEHLLYLPSAFFCLAVGQAAREVRWTRPAIAVAGVLAALLAVRAVDHAKDYESTERQLTAIMRQAPQCSRPHYNRGELGRLQLRPDEADGEYARAIEIGSRNPQEDRNLSAAWNQRGLLSWEDYLKAKSESRVGSEDGTLTLAIDRFSRAADLAP